MTEAAALALLRGLRIVIGLVLGGALNSGTVYSSVDPLLFLSLFIDLECVKGGTTFVGLDTDTLAAGGDASNRENRLNIIATDEHLFSFTLYHFFNRQF